jgi:hypothetical protein
MGNLTDTEWQSLINQIVAETLGQRGKGTYADAIALFCEEADYRSYPYGKEIREGAWIRDTDAPDISELCDWASYYDDELPISGAIDESRLDEFTDGRNPTKEEYRKFIEWWAVWRMENHRWEIVPVFDLQELTHTDGRTCVLVLSSTEGGQGGTPISDQFSGFFANKDEALADIAGCGIIDTSINDNKSVRQFVERVVEDEYSR